MTIAVTACAGVLALSAPAASADIVHVAGNVCTGTVEWRVNLAGAYADVFTTASTCKRADANVEDNGNPHVNVSDTLYSNGYRIGLVGVNVTGTNSFVGTAVGSIGAGPVAVVSPNILNATLERVDLSRTATTTEQHTGIASCGTNCYRTQVRWVDTWRP
ncbi:MAG: hypothetical protein M3340_03720 [Actinomycetota bacterium]|nr:hypothetical protein [Actinomycetota bacterium]